MTGKRKTPPTSAPEDERLWDAIAKQVKPLSRAPRPTPRPAPKSPAKPVIRGALSLAAKAQPVPVRTPAPTRRPPANAQASLIDLDRRTADRFRRGEMDIDGRLDLHGLTRAEAEIALDRFLARAHAAGQRCVLVVTGKGARSTSRDDGIMAAPRGVLKDLAPRWLGSPENRARVTAFHAAKPKDGGAGALYVLLRRQRGK